MQLLSKDMDWKMESVLDTLFRKEKFCVCIVTHSIKMCVCGFPLRVAQEFFNRPSSLVEFPNVSSFFGRFFPVPPLSVSQFVDMWNLCCHFGPCRETGTLAYFNVRTFVPSEHGILGNFGSAQCVPTAKLPATKF